METISNLAAAASKAIYGEQTTTNNATAGKEPLSGVTGKGTTDSPYDQGNDPTNPLSEATHPSTNTSTLPDRTVANADKMSSNNPFTNSNNSESNTGSSSINPLKNDSESSNPFANSTDSESNKPISYNNPFATSNDSESNKHSSSGNPFANSNDSESNKHSSSNNRFAGNSSGSDPTGPHDSHPANKADPLVDSTRLGSAGNTIIGGRRIGSDHNTTDSHGPTDSHSATGTSNIPINPNNAAEGGGPEPHLSTDKTGAVGGHGDPFVTSDKSTERSPNPGLVSGGDPTIKQQGAANPKDAPTGEQKSAIKETKENAEDFLRTKDPNDHSGEAMHMHTHTGGSGDGGDVPKTQAERRESSFGQPGGQEHGKEVAEGTGEQWVKTSGVSADGGDFDATKPGAGREANRLMEDKGVHKTEPGLPAPHPEAESGHKEKVPLGQKIKDKLHIGSHKE